MKYLIATGIYPPEIGGVATIAAQLVLDLKARGHEVTVVTYGEARQDAEVVTVPRQGGAFARYRRFAKVMRTHLTPDTIVLATDVFSVGIPTRLALIGRKNRFLVRLGGEWMWEDAVEKGKVRETLRAFWSRSERPWQQRLALWNYAWILRRAERIAVSSDFLGGILKQILPRLASKIETVWNQPTFGSLPVTTHETSHTPLRLLYIGRFARVKNVPFLAHVLRVLHERRAPIACTFVGDGGDASEVKKILAGVPNMVFSPPVAHDRLPDLFREADVTVLPSLSDICPNVVLESLAHGVPVVMTSEHGLQKPLGGVIEVSPVDMEEWQDALLSLTNAQAYEYVCARIALPAVATRALWEFVEASL